MGNRRFRHWTGTLRYYQMRPGQIERCTHDYKRPGTTLLFAAFEVFSVFVANPAGTTACLLFRVKRAFGARRVEEGMADIAAHRWTAVFPIVPGRQWVLSLPFALRYRMAYDARLTSDCL